MCFMCIHSAKQSNRCGKRQFHTTTPWRTHRRFDVVVVTLTQTYINAIFIITYDTHVFLKKLYYEHLYSYYALVGILIFITLCACVRYMISTVCMCDSGRIHRFV